MLDDTYQKPPRPKGNVELKESEVEPLHAEPLFCFRLAREWIEQVHLFDRQFKV